jgi:gliding motility-associated-like protein
MKDVNGCSISLSSQVLYTVYANVAAGFTIGPIPKFVGGNATVTFTNTSAPLDATQFTYDWTFGDDSSPESASGVGPFSVNYRLPGRKNVTLVAYNNFAQAAGLSCTSSITKTFNILLDPLVAEFKIDPTKACYPIKIKVIENLSTGDLFKWSVIDQKSRDTVASSNAAFPIFSISNDGSYFVRLVTSSSFTGQTATDTANLILYPKPEAIFDAYPQTVYIPDQEVTTINGSGNTATQWLWEFGDGDTSTDYQPSHKYKFEGVDSLKFTAQYDHGGGVICSSTNYKIITAKQGGVAKIPNAFTPSTAGPSGGVGGVDLYNYVFLPQVKGVEEFNMQIFDRWGNLIFESNSQTIGWDGYDQHGKLMPGGVYVYKLTLRLSDQQRTTQVGDVTLIR